jgi:hypothetical protein
VGLSSAALDGTENFAHLFFFFLLYSLVLRASSILACLDYPAFCLSFTYDANIHAPSDRPQILVSDRSATGIAWYSISRAIQPVESRYTD